MREFEGHGYDAPLGVDPSQRVRYACFDSNGQKQTTRRTLVLLSRAAGREPTRYLKAAKSKVMNGLCHPVEDLGEDLQQKPQAQLPSSLSSPFNHPDGFSDAAQSSWQRGFCI